MNYFALQPRQTVKNIDRKWEFLSQFHVLEDRMYNIGSSMAAHQAEFMVGQVIHHKLLGYRGVIVDVDPSYQYNDSWYNLLIGTPPKNRPWYRILVDNQTYVTYVSEKHLEEDKIARPIEHPEIKKYFSGMSNGMYLKKNQVH